MSASTLVCLEGAVNFKRGPPLWTFVVDEDGLKETLIGIWPMMGVLGSADSEFGTPGDTPAAFLDINLVRAIILESCDGASLFKLKIEPPTNEVKCR